MQRLCKTCRDYFDHSTTANVVGAILCGVLLIAAVALGRDVTWQEDSEVPRLIFMIAMVAGIFWFVRRRPKCPHCGSTVSVAKRDAKIARSRLQREREAREEQEEAQPGRRRRRRRVAESHA